MYTKLSLPNKIRTKLLKLIDYEIQLNDNNEYNIPLKSLFSKSEKPTYQINIEENYSVTNNYVYFIYNNNSDKKSERILRDYYKCMGYFNYPNLKDAKLTHNIISTRCIQTSNKKKNKTFSLHPLSPKKFSENNIPHKFKNSSKFNAANDIINVNNKFYLVKGTNQSSKAFIIEKTTDSEQYLIDLCNKLKNIQKNTKNQKSRIFSLDTRSPNKSSPPKKNLKLKIKKCLEKTILTNKLKQKIKGSIITSPKKLRKESCKFLVNHKNNYSMVSSCRTSEKKVSNF